MKRVPDRLYIRALGEAGPGERRLVQAVWQLTYCEYNPWGAEPMCRSDMAWVEQDADELLERLLRVIHDFGEERGYRMV